MTASASHDPESTRVRFEAAALPFMKSLYSAALRLTGRSEDSRDLVQETYLRAYRSFVSFRPGTNCKAWLLTILYSIFVNRYRKSQREPMPISIDEIEERFQRSVSTGSTDLAELKWRAPEVDQALSRLPETFRSAVLLVDVEELTYEEAAAALSCPVGTLRSRLFRGRKMLFVELEDYALKMGYLNRT